MDLPRWLKRRERKAAWETIPVQLNHEAAVFVAETLKSAGNPASFGGAATALRLIERAARSEFGPILTDQRINPLSPAALKHLMATGALDLSASNIISTYEAHVESREQ